MHRSHRPTSCLTILAAILAVTDVATAQDSRLGYRMEGLKLEIGSRPVELEPSTEHIEPLFRGGYTAMLSDTLGPEISVDEQSINTTRAVAVGGLALGVGVGVAEIHRRKWWEDRNVEFRFHDNWKYSRWTDKFGHYFMSSFLTRYYSSSLTWSGVPVERSQAWGAGLAWASMLYYEVLDGYGPSWGFSSGDLFFNTAGVGLTYAQWRIPELRPYTLKVTYWPSGGDQILTADYEGMTWWLTANLRTALPTELGEVIPPWLNLAVGYAARDRDERNFLTSSYGYLGFDLELSALPIDHPVWNEVAKWLKYYHIPAPAIRLYPDPAFVLFAH